MSVSVVTRVHPEGVRVPQSCRVNQIETLGRKGQKVNSDWVKQTNRRRDNTNGPRGHCAKVT